MMKESGFTLIELIIVIVILGIISSIGIIKYVDMNAQTADVTRLANAKAIESAILIFFTTQVTLDSHYTVSDAVDAYNTNPAGFFQDGQIPLKADGSSFSVSYQNGEIIVN